MAQSDGTDTEYFERDGLGSVRQLTDESGQVLYAQTFDPYGNAYLSAGSTASTFGYAGEQVDENGLIYLRARYYDPGSGRFLNMDPSRQEVNLYAYVNGNPVISIDPSGLALCLGPALLTPRSNDCWPVYSDEMTPVYIWPAVQAGDEARMTVWEIVANLNDCSDNDDTVATQPDAPYIPTATPLDPTPTPTQPAVQPTATTTSNGAIISPAGWYYPTSSGTWSAGPDAAHHVNFNQTQIDFANTSDSQVFAATNGEVVVRWDISEGGSWGNALIIRYFDPPLIDGVVVPGGEAVYVAYAHLTSASVEEGSQVTPSQLIGQIGATGYADGPHVHAEVAVLSDNLTSNPGGNRLTFSNFSAANYDRVGGWALWWGKSPLITQIWPDRSSQ